MRRRRRPPTPWPCNISRNAFGMATAVLRGRRVRGARALKATRSLAFASRRAVKRGVADACTCSSLLSAVVVSSMAAASSSSALPDDPNDIVKIDALIRHEISLLGLDTVDVLDGELERTCGIWAVGWPSGAGV